MKSLAMAAIAASLVLAAGSSRADECASYGPVATLDVPKADRAVAQNTRFRVGLHATCGGVEAGPLHRFAVVDALGKRVTHKRYFWTDQFLEVTPAEALTPGTWRLRVRRPVSADKLGKWETLVRVKVAKGLDLEPPSFAGIEEAEASVVLGTVARSPCEAVEAKVIRTTLHLAKAQDDHTKPSELLYQIGRRPKGETKWTLHRTFRPEDQRFSFETPDGWSQTWEYRVVVRDMAGNQTIGTQTATVRNPPKPPGLPREP